MNENELKIIEYLNQNDFINNRIGREIIGMSSAGLRKIFVSLSKKDIINAVGEGRNRRYKLK